MENQRGITLLELLVTITILTIISTPIFLLLNNTIKVHKETIVENQLQHEARFISQFMSEKIRDGAVFTFVSGNWTLGKASEIFFRYESSENKVYLSDTENALSSHVDQFTITPEPIENPVKYHLSLRLKNQNREFELNTTLYNNANSRYRVGDSE